MGRLFYIDVLLRHFDFALQNVPVADSLHFAESKVYGSHQCLHWWQQHATGMLRLDYSSPGYGIKTSRPHWGRDVFGIYYTI